MPLRLAAVPMLTGQWPTWSSALWVVLIGSGAGPPQAGSAPSGGDDPRSGGVWGLISCSDGVAFFADGRGPRFARLFGLDFHQVLAAVDAHLGLRIQGLDGGGDGFFAVAAGHALHGEKLVHGVAAGESGGRRSHLQA